MAAIPNTKLISLSQDKFVVVDESDYEWLNQWEWSCHTKGYAQRSQHICIEQEKQGVSILNVPKGD